MSILTQDVKVGLEAVWGLATGVVLPLDYRATVRELQDALVGFQGVAEDVDFQPLLADTRRLADALERFESERPDGASRHDADGWNHAAIRLGRILNPVMYTRGGRFHHDPAEWSPILRATKRFTLPGLHRVEGLSELSGPEQTIFEGAADARAESGAHGRPRSKPRAGYAFAGACASIPPHRFIVLSSSRPHAFK